MKETHGKGLTQRKESHVVQICFNDKRPESKYAEYLKDAYQVGRWLKQKMIANLPMKQNKTFS
jgi:hypothetical protein